MLVNKQNLSIVYISLQTIFNNAFAGAPSQWQKIAMKVDSKTSENDYAWLSAFPRMREWVGDKVVKQLEGSLYVIRNKRWEATIGVNRDDLEDDNLGIYTSQTQMAGESAKNLPDDIVFELINKGFINKCYDGQYFFDVDHPVKDVNGNVQSISNKGTKALSISTQAAAQASVGAAQATMMKFTDDEGRVLGIKPNILLVPVELMAVANALVTNDRLEDGKANPFKGAFEVVVDARLTSPTAWFLLDTNRPVKPFIFQERKAPVFVSQVDMNSDDVFMRAEYKFGAEARGNGGYGLWQMAYGSDGTAP